MPKFTFIHAADLHLGAPFRGLDAETAETFANRGSGPGNVLAEATFTALAHLEALCRETKAAFLILAGDIYDDRDGILRARFALRDMFARLGAAGVRVFIAHGNHDPLQDGPLPVAWPDNVTVFGPSVSAVTVTREGVPLALVHGISHTTPREKNNLATLFTPETPTTGHALPQVAVLHCAVGGAGDGHAPYAPCTLTDLTDAGFDYWALGHVHQGKLVTETPPVAYAGSIQGLHINETGPHGCIVVQMDEGRTRCERVSLAPVLWEKLRLPMDAIATTDDLEAALLTALEGAARAASQATGENSLARSRPPEALFCRVILEGRTALDRTLRRPGNLPTLLERLRQELAAARDEADLELWIKDIVLETRPEHDATALASRDDLVGEVARLARAAEEDPAAAEALASGPLAPLYGHHRLKKILTGPDRDNATDPAHLAGLATSAGSLLISLLEDE